MIYEPNFIPYITEKSYEIDYSCLFSVVCCLKTSMMQLPNYGKYVWSGPFSWDEEDNDIREGVERQLGTEFNPVILLNNNKCIYF